VKGIFISYRKDDTKSWAVMLAQDLVEAFGAENVFLDNNTLHAGSWRDQIKQALDRSSVMVIVIGRRWASIADASGRRRLENRDDIHRQEISSALLRNDITIIPVRVDGAPILRPEELPEAIRMLSEWQSRELADNMARRTVDLALLISDIERATGLKAMKVPDGLSRKNTPAAKSLRERIGLILTAAALSIVVLIFADMALGWSLNAEEKSLLASIVFITTLALSRLCRRFAKGEK